MGRGRRRLAGLQIGPELVEAHAGDWFGAEDRGDVAAVGGVGHVLWPVVQRRSQVPAGDSNRRRPPPYLADVQRVGENVGVLVAVPGDDEYAKRDQLPVYPPFPVDLLGVEPESVIGRRRRGMLQRPVVALLNGRDDESDAFGRQFAAGAERPRKARAYVVEVSDRDSCCVLVERRADAQPGVSPPLGERCVAAEHVAEPGRVLSRRRQAEGKYNHDLGKRESAPGSRLVFNAVSPHWRGTR